jgi:hypothetical protein
MDIRTPDVSWESTLRVTLRPSGVAGIAAHLAPEELRQPKPAYEAPAIQPRAHRYHPFIPFQQGTECATAIVI